MSSPSDLDYPRRVVVDDTDPRIRYEAGTWSLDVGSFDSLGVFGGPYNHTMHGTNSNGASFSFQFLGEFVQVRGAKDNRQMTRPQNVTSDNTTALAKWSCQVDGNPIKVTPYRDFMYDITNNMLCEQGRLSRTPHTLTLNVTIDAPTNQIWWLDRIEYSPLPDANLEKEVLKIDGSDPSIRYDNGTGNWRPIAGLFNGTGTTGASMTFNFNGTAVSLYGFNEGSDLVWKPGSGRYFVDKSGDTTFSIPGSRPLPFTSDNRSDWYNQLFFTTPKLPAGSHEMVIAYTGDAKDPDPVQWLSIDYLYVTSSAGGAQLNSSSNVPDGPSPRQGNSPVGAIAGGVIGGVVGLALITLAFFFFVKRRRAKRKKYEGPYDIPFNSDNMYAAPTTVARDVLTAQRNLSSASGTIPTTSMPTTSVYDPYRDSVSSSVANSPSSNSPLPPLVPNRLLASHEGSTTGISGSIRSPSISLRQNWSDMRSVQREVVFPTVVEREHDDSGIRYPKTSQTFVDIPPSYTKD